MPLIPLLRPAQSAPAPRVVIDREKRPTQDTSGIQRGVALVGRTAQQPLLSENYGQAPARALGAVGGAIAQGGDILGALAIKRREAESDVQIAEADKQMDLEMADFETWRRDNPDPQTWDAEWSQRMAGARERIAGAENLHPGAREQIGLRLTRWEGQSASFVSRTAARETFNQARSGFLARIDNSIANQSEDSFHADLQSAEAKGYIYPHEAEALRQQYSRTGERMQKEAQAEEERLQFEGDAADAIRDPRAWLEENKSPWKGDEIRWQKIKNIADAREREGTAEIVNQVNDLIAGGAVKTIAEIDAIESPFFTPALREQAKRHLASRDQFAEAMERETNGVRNAVEMRKRVKDYDPSRDPDRTKYFELVRDIGSRVEQSMAGELTGELYKKYGTTPPKVAIRPEIQRGISKQLDTVYDARTGAIPWERRVIVKEHGTKKEKWETDPVAKRKAIEAQTIIEVKMGDWFKEHPDATPQEATKKLNDFLPEGTRAGVLDALQKQRKPQASRGALSDDLLSTVKNLEGFSEKPFGDYKQTSIGYGTRAKPGETAIDERTADARLREELSGHAARVDEAAQRVGARLTKGQRDALISFDFNTGQGAYLLEAAKGKPDEIKRRMALYTKAGGQELAGLVKRRQTELSIFDS